MMDDDPAAPRRGPADQDAAAGSASLEMHRVGGKTETDSFTSRISSSPDLSQGGGWAGGRPPLVSDAPSSSTAPGRNEPSTSADQPDDDGDMATPRHGGFNRATTMEDVELVDTRPPRMASLSMRGVSGGHYYYHSPSASLSSFAYDPAGTRDRDGVVRPQDSQSALLHHDDMSLSSPYPPDYKAGDYASLPAAPGGLSQRASTTTTSRKRIWTRDRRKALPPWPVWRRRILTSWPMFAFCLLGVLAAAGHHVFYSTLDGRSAEGQGQLLMLRYGTLLAFTAKAGLGAAVVAAYRLRVWSSVRTRTMSVKGVDALFAATEDVLALLGSWEVLSRAKVVAALAAFVWIAPLVVILTANTLLVEMRTIVDETSCPGIRTLNFTMEDVNDWRKPVRIKKLYEVPVSLWNSTWPQGVSAPQGWFDYYTGASPSFEQTATIGAFLEGVSARKGASLEICGTGWNCSFSVAYTAPGFKCTELASGVGSVPKNLSQESGFQAKPPFGTDFLLPRGRFAYYAYTTAGEYSTPQMADVAVGGVPNTPAPWPKNMGAFRTEPVVWIGHAIVNNPDNPYPSRGRADTAAWEAAFTPKIFACEHYEARYEVRFEYRDGGGQVTNVTSRKFLSPVVNTTYLPGVLANDGTADNITAVPESNYVRPGNGGGGDLHRYRRTAAYHSISSVVREFLNGTVELPMEGSAILPIANTPAIQTRLLDHSNDFFPRPDLMDQVAAFYDDIVLSMLSNPQFAAVVWASRPGEQSGGRTSAEAATDANGATVEDYKYKCSKSRTANVYSYHARDLWIVYAIAIALTLAAIAAGLVAAVATAGWDDDDNGNGTQVIPRNTRFSSIVSATRGPALDGLAWTSKGKDGELASSVLAARIGFGKLLSPPLPHMPRPDSGGGHTDDGFGEGEGEGARANGWSSGVQLYQHLHQQPQPRYGFGLEGEVLQPPR